MTRSATDAALLAHALDQAPFMAALLQGPELRFEFANPAYYKAAGKSDLIGRPLREALPELEGQGLLELLAGVMATGEPYVGKDVPVQLDRGAGLETAYFDFTYQPVRGAGGEVEGVFVTAHDITATIADRLGVEVLNRQLLEQHRHVEAQVAERTQDLQAAYEELTAQAEELEQQQLELETVNEQLGEQSQALQRERDMIARIVDHANTGLSFMDRDLVYKWINPYQAQAWGLEPDAVVGKSVQAAFGLPADDPVLQLLRRVVATGEAHTDEGFPFEIQGPAGTRTTHWDFSYQPVKDGGAVVGVLVVALEVTERVERARIRRGYTEQLEATQRKLTGVLDSSTSGIVACEAIRDEAGRIVDFRFTLANPMSERMLFRTADEIVGDTLLTLFPGNIEAGLFDGYCGVVETGEPFETETFYQDERLSFRLHVSAVKVADGVAITFTDVTDRKRIELEAVAHARELGHQKAFAERIIENVTTGICYLDRDLVYRVANPAYCAFLQQPADQILGRYLFDVVPGGEETIAGIFRAALDEGKPHAATDLEFEYFLADGTRRLTYWDAIYLPLAGPDGAIEGVLVLANEVSTRIENERLQRERIVYLEQANIHKEQFLSILSHELRTPINAIMGFASILDDDVLGPLTAEQHAFLGKILGSSDRMLALINDLLDMSRIHAGRFSLAPQPLDAAPLCQDALAAIAPLAAQGGVALVREVAPALPALRADPQRVEQVITNLLSNAIKFTPAGGTVTLVARAAGDRLRVEVRDTGVGIAPAHHQRIFDAFTQVDMSNTRRSGGTGLGLSIAKALIEAHGGEIGVTSEVGAGATFWFELPPG